MEIVFDPYLLALGFATGFIVTAIVSRISR